MGRFEAFRNAITFLVYVEMTGKNKGYHKDKKEYITSPIQDHMHDAGRDLDKKIGGPRFKEDNLRVGHKKEEVKGASHLIESCKEHIVGTYQKDEDVIPPHESSLEEHAHNIVCEGDIQEDDMKSFEAKQNHHYMDLI